MNIACVSDIHGNLPSIPQGTDVVVIAGDISPSFMKRRQVDLSRAQDLAPHGGGYDHEIDHNADARWWHEVFGIWLCELTLRKIVTIGIAGNHDFLCESFPDFPKVFPWIYLEDEGIEYEGVKFYGSPWQPWFQNWAYNAPEFDEGEEFLSSKFDLIPEGIDVLITHSPPKGVLDFVGRRNVGSHSLMRNVQRVMPKHHVFGHIHHGYGTKEIHGVNFINAAQCDHKNKLINKPITIKV